MGRKKKKQESKEDSSPPEYATNVLHLHEGGRYKGQADDGPYKIYNEAVDKCMEKLKTNKIFSNSKNNTKIYDTLIKGILYFEDCYWSRHLIALSPEAEKKAWKILEWIGRNIDRTITNYFQLATEAPEKLETFLKEIDDDKDKEGDEKKGEGD